MAKDLHIKVAFNENGAAIMKCYGLAYDVESAAQLWLGQQQQTATAQEFASWLDKNGGYLDGEEEPAYTELRADGTKIEAWYIKGRPGRKDFFPAYIETRKDHSIVKKTYTEGQLTSVHQRQADGTVINEHYSNGQLSKREKFGNLSTIPGVTLIPPNP